MLRKLAAAVAMLIVFAVPSHAGMRLHGTFTAPTTCPHSGAGYADGCAGANQTATFVDPAFFTNVRQSGQGQYKAAGGAGSNHPPPWDVAGVDYPVGYYTPTGSLLDPNTTPISGCNTNAVTISCTPSSGGTINIKHYWFNGVGLALNGTGTPTYNFEDVRQTHTANNCRSYSGLGVFNSTTGNIINVKNMTVDFDNTCAINASLYKQTYDPGLVANSNFTGTFSAPGYISLGSLLVGTGTTGTMYKGAYIDYVGRTPGSTNATAFQLNWLAHWKGTGHTSGSSFVVDSTDPSSPNALPTVGDVLTCSGCGANGTPIASGSAGSYVMVASVGTNGSGTTLMTGLTKCVASACDNAVWDTTKAFTSSGAVAASTGPVEATANDALQAGGALTIEYSANLGWGSFTNSGVNCNSTIFRYNFNKLLSRETQHVQVNAKFGQNGCGATVPEITQNFNIVYWDRYAWAGTGTSTISYFVTNTSGPGVSPLTTLVDMSNNVVITNTTPSGPALNPTNALLRYLNQSGGSTGNVNYNLSGGVLHITALNSGTVTLNSYLFCASCTLPVQILTQTGGTPNGVGDYTISNTTNSAAENSRVIYPSPGQIDTLRWHDNYFDPTATDTIFSQDKSSVPITTSDFGGNINMLTGSTVTPP